MCFEVYNALNMHVYVVTTLLKKFAFNVEGFAFVHFLPEGTLYAPEILAGCVTSFLANI